MRCHHHPFKEAVGYCAECGEFGCQQCLTLHDGRLLCRRHYAPIAEAEARQRDREYIRRRPDRQRLVVETKDGKFIPGVCYALNVQGADFHLEVVDHEGEPIGKTLHCYFEKVKAVHYVKSFDGQPDPDQDTSMWVPEGEQVVVEFEDGTTLRGRTHRKQARRRERFYVISDDPSSNDLTVLVEQSAVREVHDAREYEKALARERERFVARRQDGQHQEEELVGDFYTTRKDWPHAMKYYARALHGEPPAERVAKLKRKLAAATHNVAIGDVKRHAYGDAKRHLEAVLALTPGDERTLEHLNAVNKRLGRSTASSH